MRIAARMRPRISKAGSLAFAVEVARRVFLRCGAERLKRAFFAVINIKHCKQFGNLQKIADALREICQFNGASAVAGARVKRHQRTQAAAVNVVDAAKVEDDLFVLRNQVPQRVPKVGGFLSKNNTPAAIHHQNSIHRPRTEFHLHKSSPRHESILNEPQAYLVDPAFARTQVKRIRGGRRENLWKYFPGNISVLLDTLNPAALSLANKKRINKWHPCLLFPA